MRCSMAASMGQLNLTISVLVIGVVLMCKKTNATIHFELKHVAWLLTSILVYDFDLPRGIQSVEKQNFHYIALTFIS